MSYKTLFQNISVFCRHKYYSTSRRSVRDKNIYEPQFENTRKYPDYPPIDISLQGYDFATLEKFQSYLHKISKRFKFVVEESFAVAHKCESVKVFKPSKSSATTEHYDEKEEFTLKSYDRRLRISSIPTVHLPLFVLLIQSHTPPGVKVKVKQHEKADYHERYIPDFELRRVQEELKSLDDPETRRLLGWD